MIEFPKVAGLMNTENTENYFGRFIVSFGNDFAHIVTTPHPRQDIIRDSGEHKVIYLEM